MESPTSYDVSVLLDALVERQGDPTDLTGVLKHIAQTARMFLKASACTIFAINPITHRLIATQTDPDAVSENDVIYDQTQLEELVQRTFEQGSLLVMNL